MIRKKILKWLLGTDIKTYIELLKEDIEVREKYIKEMQEHKITLQICNKLCEDSKDGIEIIKYLLKLLEDGGNDESIQM